MERKIGEIFEYNGEWYQCVEDTECIKCINCCFYKRGHKLCTDEDMGACNKEYRSDTKSICFKKLKKVGEPYEHYGKLYQCYKLLVEIGIRLLPDNCYPVGKDNLVEIEIKENMEEKKLNLKPFNLQKAKEGKPVCTRDGRKARIICFDVKGNFPIAVAVAELEEDTEIIYTYPLNGRARLKGNQNHSLDLMMSPEKKEGWINVYNADNGYSTGGIYSSKEEAEKQKDIDCVATIKIEWEE